MALLHTVHGHDDGAQFLLAQVLDFVNQNSNCSLFFFGGLTKCLEHIGQVDFNIPAVSSAGLRVNIETDLQLAQFDFQSTQETAQHPQTALDAVASLRYSVQVKEHRFQGRGNERSQCLFFVCFDQYSAVARLLCHATHLVEQHGFARPAQPCQHQAFLGFADHHAAEQNTGLFQHRSPTGQLGRR